MSCNHIIWHNILLSPPHPENIGHVIHLIKTPEFPLFIFHTLQISGVG